MEGGIVKVDDGGMLLYPDSSISDNSGRFLGKDIGVFEEWFFLDKFYIDILFLQGCH